MFLTKKGGIFVPTYPADYEESGKIKDGDEVRATRARNIKFHRKFFALLKLGFENQDKIEDFEIYRMIQVMKAGHVVFAKGTDGKDYPLPESLSFEKMGAQKFESVYNSVLTVIMKETKLTEGEIQNELISFY